MHRASRCFPVIEPRPLVVVPHKYATTIEVATARLLAESQPPEYDTAARRPGNPGFGRHYPVV